MDLPDRLKEESDMGTTSAMAGSPTVSDPILTSVRIFLDWPRGTVTFVPELFALILRSDVWAINELGMITSADISVQNAKIQHAIPKGRFSTLLTSFYRVNE